MNPHDASTLSNNNPWLLGWEDFLRQLTRLRMARQCWWERRHLHRLEAELGELCWQQVDFDLSVEKQLQGIQTAESAQVRLTNDIAEISEQIDLLQEQIGQQLAALQTRIAAHTDTLREAQGHLRQLPPEIAAEEEKLTAFTHHLDRLLPQSAALEQELTRTFSHSGGSPETLVHRVALARQKQLLDETIRDLQSQQDLLATQLRHGKTDLAETEKRVQTLGAALHEQHAEARRLEKHLKTETETLTLQRSALHQQRQKLDGTKKTYFQRLGSDLADVHIAPMNQPQILAVVLESRERLREWQIALAVSLQDSLALDATSRRIGRGYLVLAILALLLILCLCGEVLVAFIRHFLRH